MSCFLLLLKVGHALFLRLLLLLFALLLLLGSCCELLGLESRFAYLFVSFLLLLLLLLLSERLLLLLLRNGIGLGFAFSLLSLLCEPLVDLLLLFFFLCFAAVFFFHVVNCLRETHVVNLCLLVCFHLGHSSLLGRFFGLTIGFDLRCLSLFLRFDLGGLLLLVSLLSCDSLKAFVLFFLLACLFGLLGFLFLLDPLVLSSY